MSSTLNNVKLLHVVAERNMLNMIYVSGKFRIIFIESEV